MTVTLTFSDQHFQVIAEALGNMPLRVALPVVQEINKQVAEAQGKISSTKVVSSEDGESVAVKGFKRE